jgi:BMFP domain-containing protein YqiC
MKEIKYSFEEFPKDLQERIQGIAERQLRSVDEVVQGLWDSYLAMVSSGKPELTGLAKEIQEFEQAAKPSHPGA